MNRTEHRLYPGPIFGPVKSRRLGVSLGINLLPSDAKVCTFDCIYCECGYNFGERGARYPSREAVRTTLEETLAAMQAAGNVPDSLTFAGNGEPTIHPDFGAIVEDTKALRAKYCPSAKISVLSNATRLGDERVRAALLGIDNPILKLDSGIERTLRLLNQPVGNITAADIVETLKMFEGNFILQTLIVRGVHEGERIDNTTEREVAAWLDVVRQTHPRKIMLYPIDREPPEQQLEKVSVADMNEIAERARALGAVVEVAGAHQQ